MSAHCLVCNLTLEESNKHLNVFNLVDCPMNKLADGRTQSNTLFEVIAQILNRPLSSIILHSQVLCQGCYSKVLAIMDVQEKLQNLQADFTSSFEQTAFSQTELATTNDVLQGMTESLTSHTSDSKTEESSLENLASINFGETTSSIEIEHPIEFKDNINVSPHESQEPLTDTSLDTGKQYVCDKCGETFSANSHLVEHMLNHIDMKAHVCCICNKQFGTLSMLKVHERGHMGLKPYECEVCGKSFNERHYLTEHALAHADRKPFKCPVCEREFVRRKDMMTHTKLHSEDRPHCCPHCPKKFVVRSRLNRHLKTHSTDRPHQCKICMKSFVALADFKNHEFVHTGLKPFKCSQCGKCFGSQSNFRAHERRHKKAADKEKEMKAAIPVGDPLADPPDLKPTTELINKNPASEEQKNGVAVVKSNDLAEGIHVNQHGSEILPGTDPLIFPGSQQDEIVELPQRLPSLVSFQTPSKRNKPLGSTLSLDTDLSNASLSNEDSNVTAQQPLVLMQFPLLQEPPPLVLYSAPRNTDQAIHLADSMLAEPTSSNTLSQLQILRWDNVDDVLFQDNSNGSLVSQTLF